MCFGLAQQLCVMATTLVRCLHVFGMCVKVGLSQVVRIDIKTRIDNIFRHKTLTYLKKLSSSKF